MNLRSDGLHSDDLITDSWENRPQNRVFIALLRDILRPSERNRQLWSVGGFLLSQHVSNDNSSPFSAE